MTALTITEAHYKKMTETPVSKLITVLGIPTTVSMLITNIYNLADTYFVGTLGASQQAATGILFTLQAIIQAIAFMLGHGSGTFVAKELADRNPRKADTYVSTSFFVGAAAGTLLAVLGLCFLKPFMRLLGSTETILPYACDYGMWVLLSAPFMVCSLVLNNNLRYESKTLCAMVGLTTGGIINIFGDYLLIRVFDMGVYGAGLATAVSQTISCILLVVFYKRYAQSKIRIGAISRDISVYCWIIRVGFPSLIRQGLSSIANGLLNNLTKPFGDAAIAAMSVVNRFGSLVMCVGLGIGQGFQPVASFNYQAKVYSRVKKGLLFTMALGTVLVGIQSVAALCFAEKIVWFFQKSEEVIAVGAPALRFAAIGFLFFPVAMPVNMLYQSIRKPEVSSLLSLMRSGLAFIPTLIVTVHFFGLLGIQISQPIADILTGLISIPFTIHFLHTAPSDGTAANKGS